MQIRSVGHACLEIEAKGLRIVTDPWWVGPAYTRQWYAWPTPRPAGLDQRRIDYLYLSHGHEDHCHVATLRTLSRDAKVLVPAFLSGRMDGFLRDELGFSQVIVLQHGQTIDLGNGVKATCYINLTDSMLVIDEGEQVLVNANDALHASSPQIIDYFCSLLRERHPDIDTLFLGFSGASWFPNCIRGPHKNDREEARQRELLFVANFIRIVDQLAPRIACAYAASFVLMEPHNRWINEVKFEVSSPDVAYRRERPGSSTQAHLLLPNDVISGHDLVTGLTPRPSLAELTKAMRSTLRSAREEMEQLERLSPARLLELVEKVNARLRQKFARNGKREPFASELRLRENPETPLRVEVGPTGARAMLGAETDAAFVLELRAEILEAALRDDYGLESIVIGYGAVATLKQSESWAQVMTLLHLLSPREGSWHGVLRELRQSPLSTLEALRRQVWPLALTMGERLGLLSRDEPSIASWVPWLGRNRRVA